MELCENNQQERCQLSECDVVTNFRLPPPSRENSDSQQIIVPPIVETIGDGPVPFDSFEEQYRRTDRFPSYVHRHPAANDNGNQAIDSSRSGVQVTV